MGWAEKIDYRRFGKADFLSNHPENVLVVKDRSLNIYISAI